MRKQTSPRVTSSTVFPATCSRRRSWISSPRSTRSSTCKACGESYHVNFLGGKTSCDRCGGELYQRKDDNAETVGNRLKVYTDQTAPLIKYYTEKGVLLNVDGEGTIDEVFARICDALRK